MATNVITVNASLTVANGNFTARYTSGALQIDQVIAGGGAPGFVNIGTSEETVSFGDITTPGYVFIRNLDDTNYVTLGPDSTGMVAAIKLKAGEVALFRTDDSATWKAQANTAACDLSFYVLED